MILEGEIKDAKMSSFSSDFQTLFSFVFSLWIMNEFEKNKSISSKMIISLILITLSQWYC